VGAGGVSSPPSVLGNTVSSPVRSGPKPGPSWASLHFRGNFDAPMI
jgi:hypothetical protein